MKKKFLVALMCATMSVSLLTGCGAGSSASKTSSDPVNLTVWAAEEDQNLTNELIEKFKAAHSDTTFNITVGVESEAKAKDDLLVDPEAGADVFAFASDQITSLVKANVLQNVQDSTTVKNNNVTGSVEAATVNGNIYAYPMSADNGYFLYYDSSIITADAAKSWDTLLAACNKAGKKTGMVLASGWYNAGFFFGAGFTSTVKEDGGTTLNWNKTSSTGIKGTDVAQGILDIASNNAFKAITDGESSNAIATGDLGAIVSGTWDGVAVQKAFGKGYAATVIPTYTCAGKQVATGSAAGYKLIGVNANSKQAGWSMELALFLTNEQSQTARFEQRQIGPSNINVGKSSAVQANVALAAVTAQNATNGVVQQAGDNYWEPAKTFGEILAQGNPDKTSIQTLLDNLVSAVAQGTK